MTGGVLAVDARAHHLAIGRAVERCEEDRVLLGAAPLVVDCGIQEVPAVRQERRPAVARVPRPVHRRDRRRSAACGCHAVDRPDGVGRKEDHAISVPCAAPSVQREADRDRRTADEAHALEQVVGEERHGPVVLRPEREGAALGAREHARRRFRQRSHPQALLAVVTGCREGEHATVVGHHDRAGQVAGGKEHRVGRWRYGRSDDGGSLAGETRVRHAEADRERQRHEHGEHPWRTAPLRSGDGGRDRHAARPGLRRPAERVIELDPGVADVLQPPAAVLLQAAVQQQLHIRWHPLWQRAPVGLLVNRRAQRLRHRLAGERAGARQHLIEDAPE